MVRKSRPISVLGLPLSAWENHWGLTLPLTVILGRKRGPCG